MSRIAVLDAQSVTSRRGRIRAHRPKRGDNAGDYRVVRRGSPPVPAGRLGVTTLLLDFVDWPELEGVEDVAQSCGCGDQ
jgi:hypothetical protein